MGRIVILDNPLDTSQRLEYDHTGPLIDWLEQHYPHGFDRPHVTAFNAQQLRVADYDRMVSDNDLVVIGLTPGWTAGMLVGWGAFFMTYVVPAIVSYAISYLINSVFSATKGSKTAGKSAPDPSPTYSLSVPTNTARLGQPIPVIYGRVITTPDLASMPYSWYENNEMYAGMLFCLGQGWHEIHELRVAATPVQQLAGGTVRYQVFTPDDHAQIFGTIQAALGIYENVYTSPEVADQELDANRTSGGDDCYWVYQNSIDCAASRFVIDAEPAGSLIDCAGNMPPVVAIPGCVEVGQTVTLSSAGVNDGTYTITGLERYLDGAWLALSPPLQCVETGVSFVSAAGQIHEPVIIPGQDRYVDVYLVECETGWFVGGTCSQHPLPNYVEDGEDAITITWQEAKLLGVTVTYTLTGTLTRVRRDWDITSQIILLRVSNYFIDANQPGWPPTLCQASAPGDDTYTYDCPNLSNLSVNVVALTERPKIAFDCGEGGSSEGDIPTCGQFGIGPFVAMPPGWTSDRLQLDVVFPYGLYRAGEDGNLTGESVTLLFTAHAVDDDGKALGASLEKTVTFSAASNTPQRHTINWTLPKARYAVCARRTTAKSERAVDMSNALWTGLKAILDSKGLPVYGKTTIVGVKAKATNGLASDALNRFSVDCTRRLPDYLDSDSDGDSDELIATTDHATALADIFVNDWYGAARPFSEVDWEALRTCRERTSSTPGFNGVFDQQVSVWEALGLSVAAVHAFPATNGALLTAVEDIARATATHAFNASNIVQDSFQLSYKFNDLGAADGVEIEYRDPDTFQQEFALWPALASYPEKLTLFGCTNQAEAEAYARRIWRQRLYRREFISFATELEGHLPLIGELISIDHPLLAAPTCYIVGSITPGDDQKVTLEGHRYVPAVYRDE